MREVRRSVDPVYISAAEALLRAEGLHPLVLDAGIAAVEGGISAFPRRLVVPAEEHYRASVALAAWEASHGG